MGCELFHKTETCFETFQKRKEFTAFSKYRTNTGEDNYEEKTKDATR